MKKTVLISLAAVAMLSSCSNDDVVDVKAPNAIGFSTFVNKSTRGDDITTGTLTSFAVYGTQTQGTSTPQDIFTNEEVKGSGTGDDGTWSYTNTQYWVNGADYSFYAIAPADYGEKFNLGTKTITFDNSAAKSNVDLIYSYQGVEKAAAGENGSYDKVAFTFNHLLSRVKFEFKNVSTSTNVSLVIKDVKITNAYKSGTFDVSSVAYDATNSNDTYKALKWTLDNDADNSKELTYSVEFGDIDDAIGYNGSAKTDHYYLIPDVGTAKAYTATFEVQVRAKNAKDEDMYYPAKDEYYSKKVTLPEATMYKGYSYIYVAEVNADNFVIDPDNPDKKLQPIKFTLTTVNDWGDFTSESTYTVE